MTIEEIMNLAKSPALSVRDLSNIGTNPLEALQQHSLNNAYARPAKEMEKYHKLGLSWSPYKDLDSHLWEYQTFGQKLGNALGQTFIGEMALGIPLGFADLYDGILKDVFKVKGDDYQNEVSKYLSNLQEEYNQNHEIYTDPNRKNVAQGALTDWGWWFSNLPSVASTVSLMVPGLGASKAVSFAGKGIGAGLRAGAKGVTKAFTPTNAAKASKIAQGAAKFENWASRTSVVNKANQLLEAGAGGLAMRIAENHQESRQVYDDSLEEMIPALNGMSEEEYANVVNKNQELLSNKGIDINDRTAVAKTLAREAADKTFQMDMGNLIFDVLQMYTIGNPLKLPKNFRTTAKINKAQREAKVYARLGDEKGGEFLKNRSRFTKFSDWVSDHAGARTLIGANLTEGVEEVVNYIAQQEGIHYGKLLLDDKEGKFDSWANRLHSYMNAPELYEAGFWGILGGVMFQGVGGAIKRTSAAAYNTVKYNKNLNENTKDKEKTTFRKEWGLLAENKMREEEINSRLGNLETLKQQHKQIFEEGIDPFNKDEQGFDRTLDTDVAKQAAWNRAVDNYIVRSTLKASTVGNYNLFRDFLLDEGVKKSFSDLGIDVNSTSTESLVKRMDEIEGKYTANLKLVDRLAAPIKDVSIENIQSIAIDNTVNEINIQRLEDEIKDYEASASANEKIFRTALGDYDYKTAVNVLTAATELKAIKGRIAQIKADKQEGTVEGQLELNKLNNAAKKINEYLMSDMSIISSTGGSAETKINKIARTIWANTMALDESSEDYTDIIDALTRGDLGKVSKLVNVDFEASDDDILTLFGENNDGQYAIFASQLNDEFGVELVKDKDGKEVVKRGSVSRANRIAKELMDDYRAIADRRIQILYQQENVANTPESVKFRVDVNKNYMNKARTLAIKESADTILEMAKKYGRTEVLEYVFENKPIAKITEKDKKILDGAIEVLNLTAPSNEVLVDNIKAIILLGDYQKEVKEKKEKTGEETAPAPVETKKDKEDLPHQGKKINVKLSTDGVSFSFVDDSNPGLTFVEKIEDGEDRLYLNIRNNSALDKEQLEVFASNRDLYEGYNPKYPGFAIAEDPVLIVDEDDNIYVKKLGKVIPRGKTTTETKKVPVPESKDEIPSSPEAEIPENPISIEDETRNKIKNELFSAFLDNDGETDEEDIAAAEKKYNELKELYAQDIDILTSIKEAYTLLKNSPAYREAIKNISTIKYSTVLETGEFQHGDAFYNAVLQLVQQFNGNVTSDGKYYLDFEDFISAINKISLNQYSDPIIIAKLRRFFADKKANDFAIVKGLNDDNVAENALKTNQQRIIERIGTRDKQRVQISGLFNDYQNSETWNKAWWSLQKGTKLIVAKVENDIYLIHNGVRIGRLPKPGVTSWGTGFVMTNLGWETEVYDRNSGKVSPLEEYFIKVLTSTEQRYIDINSKINKLIYDTTISESDKNNLTREIAAFFISDSYFIRDDSRDDSGEINEAIVEYVTNIWRYKTTGIYFNNGNLSYDRVQFIKQWFDKLYDSYSAVNELYQNFANGNIEVAVENINDGELIRNVTPEEKAKDIAERRNVSYYYRYTQANKAFPNTKGLVLGVVVEPGKLKSDDAKRQGEIITHSNFGDRGTLHVIIPNRNGKDNYCIATACNTNDKELTGDAKKIVEGAKKMLLDAYKELEQQQTPDAFNTFKNILDGLVGLRYKSYTGIFYAPYDFISSSTEISFSDKKSGDKWTIYQNGIIMYENESRNLKEQSDVNVLTGLLNNCKFNFSFAAFNNKTLSIEGQGLNRRIGYNKEGEFVITIINPDTNEPFRYDSVTDYALSAGTIRVNTHSDDNKSNYRRKGKEQGANQILEVSLNKIVSSPVEEKEDGSTKSAKTKIEITIENAVNDNENTKQVDNIVKIALPSISSKTLNNLKRLGILPNNVIFANEMRDTSGKVATAAYNPNDKKIYVTQQFVNMFNGIIPEREVRAEEIPSYRAQAIRKLIHECLHKQLAENPELNKKDIFDNIEEIYNEFNQYLQKHPNEQLANYLFNDKATLEEKLEEFLVESFTSQELCEALNQIETTYEVDETKVKETLWDKILKLLAKIFNYRRFKQDGTTYKNFKVNKDSLLQKELYALQGALKKIETNLVNDSTYEDVDGFDEEGDNNYNNTDGTSNRFSTIIENVSRHSSVSSFIDHIPAPQQADIAAKLERGEIQIRCK